MRLETLGAALGLKSYGGIPATLGAGGGQEDNNMNISIDSNTSNEKEINNGLNAQEIVDKCSK